MDMINRQRAILSAVEAQGTVRVSELAQQFDVTEMTIRRDLSELEAKELVKRVHGGGISARGRFYEPTLTLRNTVHIQEKQRIARVAADLVKDGDTVALDVGSTTFEVARCLTSRRNLTIITPSLFIATLFVNQPDIRLILPGGIVRPGETSMIGELSYRAFEIFHVDRLFLGIGGIDARAGLTEYSWDDTQVKQAMLKSAKQTIAVADARKFDHIAVVKIAPLDVLDILVTDQPPAPAIAEALEQAHVRVIVAE
jgi:DeoR family transcriptional regulator, fructose operon transcriptional repressor